ncbi:MAG: hypothetical protein ACRED5_07140 [Propylenella sp.]
MSSRIQRFEEVCRLGGEFGRELAAALMLASGRGNADRALQRQMARIVLRQIAVAVEKLENAAYPAKLIRAYERAAREGVLNELLKSQAIAAKLERRAA